MAAGREFLSESDVGCGCPPHRAVRHRKLITGCRTLLDLGRPQVGRWLLRRGLIHQGLHTKTAGLPPRRWSSQGCEGLATAAGRLPVLLDREVRLVGVAFLSRVVTPAIPDRAGGEVVVAASLEAAGRRHSCDTSWGIVALGKCRRSNSADAQSDSSNSSNSRSNTSVHGTIHLGLRGLRRMAVGRDLFSGLDLGPPRPARRAVRHLLRHQPTFGLRA